MLNLVYCYEVNIRSLLNLRTIIVKNFQSLGIPSQFCDALTKLGITEPTQIQQEAIPAAVQGADILASSRTGSGKTIAYLLPLLINLEKSKDRTAIIILPTREVATQVADSLNKLLNFSRDFKHALLIGGARMDKQLQQLSRNPRILIGTPGRICDHLNRRSLSLDNTSFLVLDEVDRMLDFGFQDELNHIKKAITSPVQTLLFSATIPKEIEAMAGKYLSNPTRITVGCAVSPCADVEQATINVNHAEKYETLVKELQARHESVIIFVKTKHGAAKLAKGLSTQNFDAQAIHGEKIFLF